MKPIELLRRFFAVLMLSFMAMAILPACSSSEEAPPPDSGGGGNGCENCAQYSGEVDIAECEVRNQMRDCG